MPICSWPRTSWRARSSTICCDQRHSESSRPAVSRSRRRPRAMRWSAATGRRGRAAGPPQSVQACHGDHAFRPRGRRGALGQARRRQGRYRQARRAARQAARGQGRLLVGAGRHPVAGGECLGAQRRGQDRGGAQGHERGRRRRGQDREVAGDAGPAGAGARALWRDAARARHGEGGAGRLRGDQGQGAEPLPRLRRSGEGRRKARRPRRGKSQLREAHQAPGRQPQSDRAEVKAAYQFLGKG